MKYLKLLFQVSVFWVLSFSVAPFSAAQSDTSTHDHQAAIFELSGDVRILKHGEDQWATAKKGMIIAEKDQILTGKESFADIVYDKHFLNIARIQEKTKAEFRSIEPTDLYMEDGTVFSALDDLAGTSYQISTPTAVAGVRGTWFAVQAKGGKISDVVVYPDDKDHASVVDVRFDGQPDSVSVTENSQISVQPDKTVAVGEIKPEFKAALQMMEKVENQFGELRHEGFEALENFEHQETGTIPENDDSDNEIGGDGNPPDGGNDSHSDGKEQDLPANYHSTSSKSLGAPLPASNHPDFNPANVDAAIDSAFRLDAALPTDAAFKTENKVGDLRAGTAVRKEENADRNFNDVAMDRVGQFLELGANNSGKVDGEHFSENPENPFSKVLNNLFQGFTAPGMPAADVQRFVDGLAEHLDALLKAETDERTPAEIPLATHNAIPLSPVTVDREGPDADIPASVTSIVAAIANSGSSSAGPSAWGDAAVRNILPPAAMGIFPHHSAMGPDSDAAGFEEMRPDAEIEPDRSAFINEGIDNHPAEAAHETAREAHRAAQEANKNAMEIARETAHAVEDAIKDHRQEILRSAASNTKEPEDDSSNH